MELTVIIRTKAQEGKMNPALQEALSFLLKNRHKKVPLIYQYLHNPKAELVVDADNRIGTITNVRRNSNGDIVGDVTINDILRLASNFTGVIDNMAASYHQESNHPEIDAFIIYDKTAKDEIKVKRTRTGNLAPLAKPGEIPIMAQDGVDVMREVSEKLLKEYENMIEKQDSKSEKEDDTDGKRTD